jgi:hypothetical protein
MKAGSRILLIIFMVVMSVSIAVSKPKDKGNESKRADKGREVSTYVGADIFVDKDRKVIHEYYLDHAGHLPPGLAKRNGDLPPGLAKQLQRNGHLPPGLQKRFMPFPVELERRLPPLRPGLVRGFIDGRAVIYNPKTSVILDLFVSF